MPYCIINQCSIGIESCFANLSDSISIEMMADVVAMPRNSLAWGTTIVQPLFATFAIY